ncbi:MAG: hypothetical protein J6R13_01970, partial [Alistipes sp.]|nr:hypothetical protein [Alistipes sp.]
DTIGAVSGDGTVTACVASEIDGECATFQVPTDTEYAIYPFVEGMQFNATRKALDYTLPSEVTLDGSKKVFGDKENVAVAHLLSGKLLFRNLCGYVEVKLKGTQTVKHIALRNNSHNWDALSGYGSIYFTNADEPTIVTGTDHGSTFNFAYAVCNNVQLSSAEATSFYFIVPPRTYKNMSICIQTEKGSYSTIIQEPVTVTRSMIHPFATIDLDQITPNGLTSLAEDGVANCYVVPQGAEAKYYAFPARKINATANLEGAAYAHLSWSESETLIDNVCYDAASGNVIFKYEGNNAEGNAAIVVMDASHKILWTYHIWCTDKPENLTINSGSTKYGVMDRNIGATHTPKTPDAAKALSLTDAADAMGLYYQYGRPTPFPRIKDVTIVKEDVAYGSNTRLGLQYAFAKYNQVFTFSTAVNSYEQALTYPKAFYTIYYSSASASEATYSDSSTVNDTWYGKTVYHPFNDRDKLWYSEDADIVSKKSDNDPCPAGYVVDENVGASAWMGGKQYTTVNNSVTQKAMGYYYQDPASESLVWLPAQGFRSRGSAVVNYIGSNYNLWTAYSTSPANNLNCVRISGGNPSFNTGYLQASQAFGIRCRMVDRSSLQQVESVSAFEGQGTEAAPYLIKTANDMIKLAGLCGGTMTAEGPTDFKTAHYALAGNIDMAGMEMMPVSPFNGVFDGKTFTISGVTITPVGGQPNGLFGTIENATIKNLNLENSVLNVTTNDLHTGGFVGMATGSTIDNCNFRGTVMSACSASFASTSGSNGASAVVGGIVAYAINTTVSNCNISGAIEASKGQFTGGVTGHFEGGKIDNCKILNGTYLYSSMNHTAGIAGRITCDAEITNCVVDAPVICGYATNGGIVGRMQSGVISNCLVTSNSEIIGHKNQSAVSYTDTGGLVGLVQTAANQGTKAIIKDCACYANVSANTYVGGLFGQLKATAGTCEVNVVNCLFKGHVTCVSKNTYNYGVAAGIVGSSNNGATMDKTNLVNCVALVDGISFNSSATAAGFGGLIGYAKHTDTYASYTNLEIADIVSQEGKAIAEYSSLKNWGALFGLGHGDTTMCKFSDVYYSSVGDKIGATASGAPTYTNTEGMTSTQMTDGTLLAKLNAAVSTWNSTAASNLQASTWVAGADGYPVPSSVPADTGSAAGTVKKTRVSLIGDSISTFKGWLPAGYNSFYPIATNPTVISATQTYWYKLIYKYMSNAVLEKNIAWTGTVVARSTDETYLTTDHGAGHCFVERFRDDGMGNPDVILLHGGTNDVGNRGKSIAVHPNYPTYGGSGYSQSMCPTDAEMAAVFSTVDAATTWEALVALNDTSFVEAYSKLVAMMHFKHPNAKVVMLIGDWIHAGTRQAIHKIADHYGAKYGYKCVDFQDISPYGSYNVIPKESGCHPNEAGFEVMADYIYKQAGSYIDPKN